MHYTEFKNQPHANPSQNRALIPLRNHNRYATFRIFTLGNCQSAQWEVCWSALFGKAGEIDGIFNQKQINMADEELLKEIPSDSLVVMTSEFKRLFSSAGCDPACHFCWENIPIGGKFKLSTINKLSKHVGGSGYKSAVKLLKGIIKVFDWNGDVKIETQEVMLCSKCTPEMYMNQTIEDYEKKIQANEHKGCYRINGKLVH